MTEAAGPEGTAEGGRSLIPDPRALPVVLVPLRRRHLRAVLRIEAQVYPRPWSLPLFMSELNLRTSRHYVAARVEGQVVGYAGLMFSADEGHVTNIAVDPAWHRHQIGTRLLLHHARAAIARQARHLTLEVRMSNLAAQAMYRRFGFVTAGVRKNYYSETNEDALIMWAYDIDSEDYAARMSWIEAAVTGGTIDETGTP
ncbi:MAG: ribosomal protein S18-alanine N-acetyltransferase [Actinomycetota bacterium]|nr:ribosomal protein S18-alanine N-acetyltransferase [Actinomycetota bacterium]